MEIPGSRTGNLHVISPCLYIFSYQHDSCRVSENLAGCLLPDMLGHGTEGQRRAPCCTGHPPTGSVHKPSTPCVHDEHQATPMVQTWVGCAGEVEHKGEHQQGPPNVRAGPWHHGLPPQHAQLCAAPHQGAHLTHLPVTCQSIPAFLPWHQKGWQRAVM